MTDKEFNLHRHLIEACNLLKHSTEWMEILSETKLLNAENSAWLKKRIEKNKKCYQSVHPTDLIDEQIKELESVIDEGIKSI